MLYCSWEKVKLAKARAKLSRDVERILEGSGGMNRVLQSTSGRNVRIGEGLSERRKSDGSITIKYKYGYSNKSIWQKNRTSCM
jgi:hypothetical protein